MTTETPTQVGNAGSVDALFGSVYDELRRLAHSQRCRTDGSTLNTTALVHELYLHMNRDRLAFGELRQFYAYAARAMRHLLIDRARERTRLKRGGAMQRLELDDEALLDSTQINPEQALELDAALRQLAAEDARAAEIVELHYFAGLSIDAVAELLGRSTRTVFRDWRYARAFLYARLGEDS